VPTVWRASAATAATASATDRQNLCRQALAFAAFFIKKRITAKGMEILRKRPCANKHTGGNAMFQDTNRHIKCSVDTCAHNTQQKYCQLESIMVGSINDSAKRAEDSMCCSYEKS